MMPDTKPVSLQEASKTLPTQEHFQSYQLQMSELLSRDVLASEGGRTTQTPGSCLIADSASKSHNRIQLTVEILNNIIKLLIY